jgi:Protein of unknown function (DUF2970)
VTNTGSSGDHDGNEQVRDLGFWELVKSTSSAFIGVQSNANRERDFSRGKISHFIWMGLLFGLLFVGTLIGVVQLVLHFTGN